MRMFQLDVTLKTLIEEDGLFEEVELREVIDLS